MLSFHTSRLSDSFWEWILFFFMYYFVQSNYFLYLCSANPQNTFFSLMKHFLFACLLALPALQAFPAGRPYGSSDVLPILDRMIGQRQLYIDRKEADIAHQKELYSVASGMQKFSICSRIYESYNGFNTDSAFHYSQECLRLARQMGDEVLIQRSLIYVSRCMSINCLYESAQQILDDMEGRVFPDNLNLYAKAYTALCFWESEFTTLPEVKERDRENISRFRRLTILTEDSYAWRRQEEAILLADSAPTRALELLMPVLDSLPADDDNVRFLSNSIGSFYGRLGQQDSALYYYAVSALADMEHGVMEHASLREVALILFRRGDVERAYRYMNCCIEDAQFCKARLRTIEMAGDMPVILDAYQLKIARQQTFRTVMLIVLACGLVLLILLLAWSYRSGQRLASARAKALSASEQLKQANLQLQESLRQLEESNQSLRDSNRIRSAYVTQYMKECSDAIEKLGIYHQKLLKTAMQSNYQKLLEAIKSREFVDDSLKSFYQHFDDTFLSLFPQFVEDFNKLLKPDQQFELPQNARLSTELRIFALIRLGITDSEDIAHFLRLSTKTVYNYRATVRNRALASRDLLEEHVMQIGL